MITEPAGQCRVCHGPCATYKGSVHRWTCQSCLERYIAESAAKAEAKTRAELDKRARKAARAWEMAPGLKHRIDTESMLIRTGR